MVWRDAVRAAARRGRAVVTGRPLVVSDAAASPTAGFSRRPVAVATDKLLLGAQGGLSGAVFARLCGDLLWTSTPVGAGPHADLLRRFRDSDPGSLTLDDVRETSYWSLGSTAIRIFGRYFDAVDDEGLLRLVRTYLAGQSGDGPVPRVPRGGDRRPPGSSRSRRSSRP